MDFNNGITFLELISVIAIVSILLTVAIPTFADFMDRFRVKLAAENLAQNLEKARSEAIKQSINVHVSFTTGDTWCYGFNTGSACDCSIPSSCNLGTTTYPQALQTNLTVSGFVANSFYFEGSHGAASQTGNITFATYGKTSPLIQTTINRIGSSEQCATGISSYTDC